MFEEDKIVETKAIKNLRDRFKKLLLIFGAALIFLFFSKHDELFKIKIIFILLTFIVTIFLNYKLYELEEELDKKNKEIKQLKMKIENLYYYQTLTDKQINNISNIVFPKPKDFEN